jgi:hypothetical protein
MKNKFLYQNLGDNILVRSDRLSNFIFKMKNDRLRYIKIAYVLKAYNLDMKVDYQAPYGYAKYY